MLKILVRLLKALNSEANPAQLAWGITAGMIVGLTPLWSLHNILVVLLVFIFRVNLSAFFLFWLLFSGVAYLFDPLMDRLGASLLAAGPLRGLWTWMYNSDLWRLAHFNNTLTLGSLVSAVVLAAPVFFISRYLVVQYRGHVLAWVQKSRVMQIVKASNIYRLYSSLSLGGPS